jgi:hypothetical protein
MDSVLVIGGTGGFGTRLVRGLAEQSAFNVVIAGRDLARCEHLAKELNSRLGESRVSAARIDNAAVTAEQLRATGATIVVDAAGPFQGNDYRLARAAIAARLHYVDLADARDFVAQFGSLHDEACQSGVIAVTGASSTPALSNAVLDQLTAGWRRIDHAHIAISPGNHSAPRGLSVLQAILSYAGKPVRLFLNGAWTIRPGWGLLIRQPIAGLGTRWLSLCETPDLDIVAARFQVKESVIFRAGLELSLSHLGLSVASFAVRIGLLESLRPFARLFQRAADLMAGFGADRGGMMVEAEGIDADSRPIRATWTLVAEAGDGPMIPTLPALAMIRAISEGLIREPGAKACVGLLDLSTIAHEFLPYRISSQIDIARPDQ